MAASAYSPRTALAGGAALLLTIGMTVTSTPAFAAEACVTSPCTVTFTYTGSQTSWTVPSHVTELTVTVAGAAGDAHDPAAAGSSGAVVTVNLDTALAGQPLQILVGGKGKGSMLQYEQQDGGEGSYLAVNNAFLVVSGGGGGGGTVNTQPGQNEVYDHSTNGGDGSAIGNAADGTAEFDSTKVGKGATPTAPGAAGAGSYGGITATQGSSASISGGVISEGRGGYAVPHAGGGGGGYFGGGGGTGMTVITQLLGPVVEYSAGGGGSGFLAATLTANSTGTNDTDGYITFSYLLPGLAATGSDPGPLPGLAGILVLTGAGMLLWRRKFSVSSSST